MMIKLDKITRLTYFFGIDLKTLKEEKVLRFRRWSIYCMNCGRTNDTQTIQVGPCKECGGMDTDTPRIDSESFKTEKWRYAHKKNNRLPKQIVVQKLNV